jgi:phage regulator Rha-like protein
MSNNIIVVQQDNTLVVDSRLIALDLGVEHESVMRLIYKHQAKLEAKFGILRFQIGEIIGRGQPEKFAWLNEGQSTVLMTLSRNTDRVVELKFDLVEKFELAKNLLKQIAPKPTLEQIDLLNLDRETLNLLTHQTYWHFADEVSKTQEDVDMWIGIFAEWEILSRAEIAQCLHPALLDLPWRVELYVQHYSKLAKPDCNAKEKDYATRFLSHPANILEFQKFNAQLAPGASQHQLAQID